MLRKEPIILPPTYYLTYFEYLIGFIEKHSGHLLGPDDVSFISDFRQLSLEARCAMVRMANRKGRYFRLDKFQYEEIPNVGLAIEELVEAGFASLDLPPDPAVFALFTKSELSRLFPADQFEEMRKEAILAELQTATASHYQTLSAAFTVVDFTRQSDIDFLKLLFFGHNHGEMTEFVIRDVGNVKLENLENHAFTPWFESHEEARAVFTLGQLSRAFWELQALVLPDEVLNWLESIEWSQWLSYPRARKKGDSLMLRIGEYLEKCGKAASALPYYALSRKHPSRERRIRIYEKLGQLEDAVDLAQFALEKPLNASEHLFASDFLAKKSKRNYRTTTQKMKDNPQILVPAGADRVEELALRYLREEGYEGAHTENYLWRSLFALVFWEELFSASKSTFHHPLQRMPSDLHDELFFETRGTDLKHRLAQLKSKKAMRTAIEATYREKEGISNYLISWHPSLPLLLEQCIRLLPLSGIKSVLLEIAKNPRHHAAGFPDLFVWRGSEHQFYEIKSPNDHLSAQQLFWLDFFATQKINAGILRVYYS